MHTHVHTHTHTRTHTYTQCMITGHILAHEFSELAAELNLTSENGEVCHVDDHDHHEHDEEEHESEEGK